MEVEAQKQELPNPEKTSGVDGNDAAVQSAVKFLKVPSMQRHSVESKINFLLIKGLSVAQIQYAFEQVGQPISREYIETVQARRMKTGAGMGRAATAVVLGDSSMPSNGMGGQQRYPSPGPFAENALPYRTQNLLFPSSSPAHGRGGNPAAVAVASEPKGTDWRDVVIGLGAAALAGFTGVKLFQRYSPYELRRKGEKRPIHQGSFPSPGLSPSRRRAGEPTFSEDGEHAPIPTMRAMPTPPLPQPPSAAAISSAKDEEIKRLEGELKDAKDALANERKRSADLSIAIAKTRAEKQQLVNKNDRLGQRVEDLEEKLLRLETAAKEAREREEAAQNAPEDAQDDEEGAEEEGGERGEERRSEEVGSPTDDESSFQGITTDVSPQPEDASPLELSKVEGTTEVLPVGAGKPEPTASELPLDGVASSVEKKE